MPVAAALTDAAGEGETAGRMELELASGTGAATLISPALTRRGTAHKAFQRVKAEEWLDKTGAHDNSYKATFGSSGWGAKAQEVLGQVRHPLITVHEVSGVQQIIVHAQRFPMNMDQPSTLDRVTGCGLDASQTRFSSICACMCGMPAGLQPELTGLTTACRRSEARISGMRRQRRSGAPTAAALLTTPSIQSSLTAMMSRAECPACLRDVT